MREYPEKKINRKIAQLNREGRRIRGMLSEVNSKLNLYESLDREGRKKLGVTANTGVKLLEDLNLIGIEIDKSFAKSEKLRKELESYRDDYDRSN